MELSQAISQAIMEFGKDIITEPRFVNILADYDAFSESRVLRTVVREMVEQGFTKKFVNLNYQKQYEDEVVRGLVHDALDIFPYRENLIQVVVKSFILGRESCCTKTRNSIERTAKTNTKPKICHLTDFQISKDGKTLIKANDNLQGEVLIPHRIEIIGEGAFSNNNQITKVFIQEGVKVIESSAFSCCQNLARVFLPHSLQKIGASAFFHCFSLQSISIKENVCEISFGALCGNVDVSSSNKYLKSINGSVFSKDGKILYYVPSNTLEYNVPDGIKTLTGSFHNNKKIKKVFLPNTLKTIGWCAFDGCNELSNVVLPNGLKEIGNWSFSGCYSLEELIIPASVKWIDHSCFSFSKLKRIIFKSTHPEKMQWEITQEKEAFWMGIKADTIFYVPKVALERYRALLPFKNVIVKSVEELYKNTE